MPSRIPGLDLLRAIAILSVVALHASQLAEKVPSILLYLSSYGWIGVDIFFVLSGYLIGIQLFQQEQNLQPRDLLNFYLKRLFRTLPLYFVVLFFYVAIKPRLGFPFQGNPWNYLFFLQNYTGVKDFVPSWSLCIEEQFYLFFPLLTIFWRYFKISSLFWLLPLLISLFLRASYAKMNLHSEPNIMLLSNDVMFKTHMHLDGLSMGILLAATNNTWKKWSVGRAKLSLSFGLLIIFSTLYLAGPSLKGLGIVYIFSALALGISLLFPWAINAKIPKLVASPANKIALWSYGIYIWNDVVSRFLHKIPQTYWLWTYFLFFFLSFSIAILSFQLIEKSFLHLRQKILLRR